MLSLLEAVANGLGVGALTCFLGDADPRLRRVFPDLPGFYRGTRARIAAAVGSWRNGVGPPAYPH